MSASTVPQTAFSATDQALVTVVSLSAVTWDFQLVGRTRMLTEAWARGGQPTVFVQVPSLRTALQRVTRRPARPDGIPVVRPWPTYPARLWPKLGQERLERSIARRAAALRCELDQLAAWDRAVAVVISPVWAPWLAALPFRSVIYDCIDELAVHVPRPELAPLYEAWEDRLLARVDGAVVTAEGLAEKLRRKRPALPLAVIRNGVDVERFRSLAESEPHPSDLPGRGRPIVGFVGALYDWIDWDLIRDTAREVPQFDFTFVGPHDRRGSISSVRGLANVHLLGPRPYAQVPAYLAACDVCWVPFKQNAVGQAANPVKIYEYLALGKPVVTTPVADTGSFVGLVQVARTAEEMAERLRAAVVAPKAGAAERIAFAQQNSWHVRARQYVSFIQSLDRTP